MSKLSQLKQKAYQAGKDRNWDLAISVYEQILEVEKNNPTVINELGDLCLKSGDTRQAIKHFLSAATKYRKTGLLNNSVAICKKILRHEDSNIHAHWYLAEIRASQDLVVEGENHGLAFINGGELAGGEIQEIYTKRCGKLLELYPASRPILERLVSVFRGMGMTLEAARAGCLIACVIYDSGDQDEARKMVDDFLVDSPEIKNYPEFGKWNKRVNPDAVDPVQATDYNSVSLEDAADEPTATTEPQPATGSEVPATDEISFEDIAVEIPVEAPAEAPVEVTVDPVTGVSKDDEGCLVIDAEDQSDLTEIMAQAAKELVADDDAEDTPVAVVEVDSPAEDEPSTEGDSGETVDLLAQILSEDSEAVLGDDAKQLATIASEIGSVVGGNDQDDDAGRFYEMGMVYLEMGLFDKACESFETAAADDEYTIRAHEMWGITLQRAEQPNEAIKVLMSGLQFAEGDSRENLGLRYHIAKAHEMADRAETAQGIYEEIHAVAPNFLDVTSRLAELARV